MNFKEISCKDILDIDIVNDVKFINMHEICCKFILDKNNSDEDKLKVIKNKSRRSQSVSGLK